MQRDKRLQPYTAHTAGPRSQAVWTRTSPGVQHLESCLWTILFLYQASELWAYQAFLVRDTDILSLYYTLDGPYRNKEAPYRDVI